MARLSDEDVSRLAKHPDTDKRDLALEVQAHRSGEMKRLIAFLQKLKLDVLEKHPATVRSEIIAFLGVEELP